MTSNEHPVHHTSYRRQHMRIEDCFMLNPGYAVAISARNDVGVAVRGHAWSLNWTSSTTSMAHGRRARIAFNLCIKRELYLKISRGQEHVAGLRFRECQRSPVVDSKSQSAARSRNALTVRHTCVVLANGLFELVIEARVIQLVSALPSARI